MTQYYLNFNKIKELTQNGDNYLVKLIHRYVQEYSGGKIILEKEIEKLTELDLDRSLANFNNNVGLLTNQIDIDQLQYPPGDSGDIGGNTISAGNMDYNPHENVYSFNEDTRTALDDSWGATKSSEPVKNSTKDEIFQKLWAFHSWYNENVPFNKLTEKTYKKMIEIQKIFCKLGDDMRLLTLEINKDVLKAKQQIELEKKQKSLDLIETTLIHNGILCSIETLEKENQIII